jgi:hypothetical protein
VGEGFSGLDQKIALTVDPRRIFVFPDGGQSFLLADGLAKILFN